MSGWQHTLIIIDLPASAAYGVQNVAELDAPFAVCQSVTEHAQCNGRSTAARTMVRAVRPQAAGTTGRRPDARQEQNPESKIQNRITPLDSAFLILDFAISMAKLQPSVAVTNPGMIPG